jgi:hypothetical protein
MTHYRKLREEGRKTKKLSKLIEVFVESEKFMRNNDAKNYERVKIVLGKFELGGGGGEVWKFQTVS